MTLFALPFINRYTTSPFLEQCYTSSSPLDRAIDPLIKELDGQFKKSHPRLPDYLTPSPSVFHAFELLQNCLKIAGSSPHCLAKIRKAIDDFNTKVKENSYICDKGLLYYLIYRGHLNIEKRLIQLLIDLQIDEVQCKQCANPLLTACIVGNEEIAASLLQKGAHSDPESTSSSKDVLSTPLYAATKNENKQLVHLLLSHGADPKRKDSASRLNCFELASLQENAELLSLFFSYCPFPPLEQCYTSSFHLDGAIQTFISELKKQFRQKKRPLFFKAIKYLRKCLKIAGSSPYQLAKIERAIVHFNAKTKESKICFGKKNCLTILLRKALFFLMRVICLNS